MTKKRKTLIIGVVIIALGIIAALLYIVFGIRQQQMSQPAYNNTAKQAKQNAKRKNPAYDHPQKLVKNTKIDNFKGQRRYVTPGPAKMPKYLYRHHIAAIGGGNQDGNSKELKNRLLQLCASQQYKTYTTNMKQYLNQYRFNKSYGLDIAGLYTDEKNFQNLLHDDSMGAQDQGKYFASNIKTPEGFAIFGLYMDQIARGRFIIDPLSISPIGFSNLKYLGTSVYNNPDQIKTLPTYAGFNAAEDIFKLTGENSVYIVHLSLTDNTHTIPYDAIIGENNHGQLALLGYYTNNQNLKIITDKPLKYFYQKKFMEQYENAANNNANASKHGNVDVNKLYPWIEKGGTFN